MNREKLLQKIKRVIEEYDRDSQVILFGSRSRGDAAGDSDWDILILLSSEITVKDKAIIRHNLYDIELESGEVISTIFYEQNEWNSEKNRISLLFKNVTREGHII